MVLIPDEETGRMKLIPRKDLYDEIKAYNKMEKSNAKAYYFIPLLIEIAEKKGYDISFLDDKSEKDKCSEENKDKRIKDMIEATTINEEEYEKLLNKQKANRATDKDKLMIKKYVKLKTFGIKKLDEKFLETYPTNEPRIYNMVTLIDDKNIKNWERDAFLSIDYKVKEQFQRNKIIRDLINMLGFDHGFDKRQIKKEDFEKNVDKVMKDSIYFKNLEKNLILFGTKKPTKDTNRSAMANVNVLLGRYGLKVYSNSKRTMVNGTRTYKWFYEIKPLQSINEFIEFKTNNGCEIENTNNLDYKPQTYKWKYLTKTEESEDD